MENKTLLIVGGLAIGAVAVMYLLKQNSANQVAALNQPGLLTQPSIPAQIGSGISLATSAIGNLFSSAGSDPLGLNDPGLEYDDATAFPGMDYNYANSSSYAPSPSDPSSALYGGS